MIEFALGAVAGVFIAVLSPKAYAWAADKIADLKDRFSD